MKKSASVGHIERFFLWCSGASLEILMLDECKTDRPKYVSMGFTVLVTGVFAFISSSYALSRVFVRSENVLILSFIVGLVWGLAIFNLDRFMVSSIRKNTTISNQIVQAVPRLMLALLIALVIVKPLEVRIFSDRIESEIVLMQTEALSTANTEADRVTGASEKGNQAENQRGVVENLQSELNSPPNSDLYRQTIQRINQLNQNKASLEANLASIRSQLNNLRDQSLVNEDQRIVAQIEVLTERRNAVTSNLRQVNENLAREIRIRDTEVTRDREEKQRVIERERSTLETLHQTAQTALEDRQSLENRARSASDISYTANLITQIEALGRLSSVPFSVMWWTSKLIMALFFMLEIAPILVKMLVNVGPYDYMLAAAEDAAEKRKSLYEQSLLRMSIDRSSQAEAYARLMEEDLYKQLSIEQQKIHKHAVALWSQQQIESINLDVKKGVHQNARDYEPIQKNILPKRNNSARGVSNQL